METLKVRVNESTKKSHAEYGHISFGEVVIGFDDIIEVIEYHNFYCKVGHSERMSKSYFQVVEEDSMKVINLPPVGHSFNDNNKEYMCLYRTESKKYVFVWYNNGEWKEISRDYQEYNEYTFSLFFTTNACRKTLSYNGKPIFIEEPKLGDRYRYRNSKDEIYRIVKMDGGKFTYLAEKLDTVANTGYTTIEQLIAKEFPPSLYVKIDE